MKDNIKKKALRATDMGRLVGSRFRKDRINGRLRDIWITYSVVGDIKKISSWLVTYTANEWPNTDFETNIELTAQSQRSLDHLEVRIKSEVNII